MGTKEKQRKKQIWNFDFIQNEREEERMESLNEGRESVKNEF